MEPQDPLGNILKKRGIKNLSANASSSGSDSSYSNYGPSPTQSPASSPPLAPPPIPKEAVATAQAIQGGANPDVLTRARQALGSKDFIGLCERFVELSTSGAAGKFASAIEAWKQQPYKVPSGGLEGIQPGDAVYFNADKSNSGYGHTGVYTGNGNMISATNSGVKETPIDKWSQLTGQKVLGYVPNRGGK